ncbi:hypothetical protein GCM10023082_07590 [Streptomyces tremellae]|uniref:Rieske domain-containing protein n=1 Tax=Streptomyces tremellae TaxID=1124239 RepID=A0ABP7E561_9ACTN
MRRQARWEGRRGGPRAHRPPGGTAGARATVGAARSPTDERRGEAHDRDTAGRGPASAARGGRRRRAAQAGGDLRRIGVAPDFWYPVATSRSVRRDRAHAASCAGERIALYRGGSGTVYALEDRCAHRHVPLSMGVVEGEALRCCCRARVYRGNGRISQIPSLPKGAKDVPRGVRAHPAKERYGLVWVPPGGPEKAATAPLPDLPQFAPPRHRTMTFSRTVRCHYSFMHENLLDMYHQFLHRSVLGRIRPTLLGYESGTDFVEARYLFTPAGGRKDRGAGLLSAEGVGGSSSPDVITIRTQYPLPPSRRRRRRPTCPRSRSGWRTCPRTRSSAPATRTAC